LASRARIVSNPVPRSSGVSGGQTAQERNLVGTLVASRGGFSVTVGAIADESRGGILNRRHMAHSIY
jgi:hypothetical protein